MPADQPSAQEILLVLFSQKRDLIAAGGSPTRVVLSMQNYRTVQRFHASLGELPNPEIDYITRYTIFDLPVFTEEGTDSCRVE